MSCKYLLTEETVSRRHRLVPLAAGVFFVGGLFPHNLLLERDAVVGGDTHDVDACGEA